MYCSRCGTRNDDDAKFCEKCGADLGAMPKPTVTGSPPAPAPPLPTTPPLPPLTLPPLVYPPGRRHAWWYPIGVWVILASFFLFIDLVTTHSVTWSVWPIGLLGIFMVGFPILHLLEERSSRSR